MLFSLIIIENHRSMIKFQMEKCSEKLKAFFPHCDSWPATIHPVRVGRKNKVYILLQQFLFKYRIPKSGASKIKNYNIFQYITKIKK